MGSLVPSTIGCSYHIYELSRCKMKDYIKKTFHQRFTLRPFRPDFEFELLLLGADGSGKSTFIRQMQLIHGHGFNDNDKVDLVPDVYDNIFDAMTVLARQIEEDRLDIPIEAPRWEDIETFRNSENPIPVRLEAVRKLWADPGIQSCYSRRSEFSTLNPINVSAKYFLDQIGRISESGYLPITEDIIRVRRGTKGIPVPYEFFVSGIKFKITDVGGDREQRQNWIDVIGNQITCIIFLAAIDEFDTYIPGYNKREKNKLVESLEVFAEIQNNPCLKHKTFILFLNKVDVFKDKILTANLIDHFADFPEGLERDEIHGLEFLKDKFLNANLDRNGRRKKDIYSHQTTATDTDTMRFVFEVVKDTILRHNLKQYNLV